MFFSFDAYTQTEELDKAKAKIAELFKPKNFIFFLNVSDAVTKFDYWGTTKDVFVYDDRIEFSGKKENSIIYYHTDFPYINIKQITDIANNIDVEIGSYQIQFKGNVNGKLLADNLNIIKNYYSEKLYNSQLIHFKPTKEMSKVKAQIAELLKIKVTVLKTTDKNPEKQTWPYWGTEKNVSVFDDRIEFKLNENVTTFYFANFHDVDIRKVTDHEKNVGVIFENFYMQFKGILIGKLLADNLIFIRNQLNEEKYDNQLALFVPTAANYRSLAIKPAISEQQRERIIQANLFNQQRQYDKAIEYYIKAIEVDSTAYPSAYTNLALLSAQVRDFLAAIYYMKKYLMLEPDAEDARICQDKIYEWNALLGDN